MSVKTKPEIDHKKIKGIKPRSAAIVDMYIELFKVAIETHPLIDVVSSELRIAMPESYSQLNLNGAIRTRLQEMGYINPSNTVIPTCAPIDIGDPVDIHNYNVSRYRTNIFRLNSDIKTGSANLFAGDLLKVTRVAHSQGLVSVTSLLNNQKSELDFGSTVVQEALKQADFFYEQMTSLSVGDILMRLESPGDVLQVTDIDESKISAVDAEGVKTTIKLGTVEARMISHGYAAQGEDAKAFNPIQSLIIVDGDDKSRAVKLFFQEIIDRTKDQVTIFGVEKTQRKSVSIVCPSDMIKSIEKAVEKSKKSHKEYVESLIDELYNEWENSSVVSKAPNTYMMFYSSPPYSKSHAYWISEDHYSRLKEFCEEHGLKVNPTAMHLVMRDLLRRKLISLDPLLQ
ncbi:hypothetical protein [Alteromonas macleodii]|uniref:Uncharacterized protein n=1 Tax=Alteromonas macleodii TaxID=28108 RepID=A0AB36FL95_ALTMA|nr:hypothetical protein [Alteromonas macleodii]OES24205.1 hypothetical protein BFV93_4805 [Alteromonas macleodii]OES24837.1 hypothetical protein BFV95_4596 [Alteromonas macleodii]OES25115.1 hypothetical protein BFV94_4586 [Alteromonas macleodii]OES39158.1 hypothetical protein BFV96_4306 [Alteromonas macleodii]